MKNCPLLAIGGLFLIAMGCKNVNASITIPENKGYTESHVKRKLKAGENHQYSIELDSGKTLHIKAEHYGIDLIAKVSTSDGRFAEQFDSPTGELDAENIYALGYQKTRCDIEIYPAQKYAWYRRL